MVGRGLGAHVALYWHILLQHLQRVALLALAGAQLEGIGVLQLAALHFLNHLLLLNDYLLLSLYFFLQTLNAVVSADEMPGHLVLALLAGDCHLRTLVQMLPGLLPGELLFTQHGTHD